MYGGAKLTLVAMTPVVIFYAIAFTWIWPFMTHGISALTGFMKNAGVAGFSSMASLKNSSSPPACTISSGRRSSSRKSAAR
jgi:PTS system arbutin-like IIC component